MSTNIQSLSILNSEVIRSSEEMPLGIEHADYKLEHPHHLCNESTHHSLQHLEVAGGQFADGVVDYGAPPTKRLHLCLNEHTLAGVVNMLPVQSQTS